MTPVVALLHGFTGSPSSWDEVVARMPGDWTVLAPALVGHRGGPKCDPSHGFAAEVDRLADWIARKSPGPAHLVGYSLGARLALGMLVRHPKRFARATLIGLNPGLSDETQRKARVLVDEHWCELLETHGIDAFARAWQDQPLFASQRSLSAEVLAAQHQIRLDQDPRGLSCALRQLGLGAMPCWRSRLSDIEVPVHLVSGAQDEKFSALASDVAAQLARATVERVPGVGHNPVLESPALVAETLQRGMCA